MTKSHMADCDVIILCGGLGTRLQSVVADRPKPMAEIHGRPFVSLLVEHFLRHGARRFIFSTGHFGEMIEDWFLRHRGAYETLFVRDPVPLGTGGALAHAMPLVRSNPFLVLNGDSFCEIDPERLLRFHLRKRAGATIAVTRDETREDTGAVALGEDDRMLSMVEKPRRRTTTYHNAGVYLFDRAVTALFPETPVWSLERELLPRLVTQQCYGFVTASPLHDIGTPERLAHFRETWKDTSAYFPTSFLNQRQGSMSR
ncbi:MAG: NTP transferase domain-containing protein [Nitrospira sp. CR1.1]|jgi:NDP-sugar pyrophosphorylase family protein|nr:NTP transferase domain-containing protein [Nitrospira sp. CR1.1]